MPHPIDDSPLVYIFDENVFGIVLQWGAHVSFVKYNVGGLEYQVWMENNEFHTSSFWNNENGEEE